MTRRRITTGSPFEQFAGYSRAVVVGDFVFVSGTTGYDYASMRMPDSVEAQTRNCFLTIGNVLAEIRPAATLLVVAGLLRPEMKVEIEVTARRENSRQADNGMSS